MTYGLHNEKIETRHKQIMQALRLAMILLLTMGSKISLTLTTAVMAILGSVFVDVKLYSNTENGFTETSFTIIYFLVKS